MELRTHIGICILLVVVMYLAWFKMLMDEQSDLSDWYLPVFAGLIPMAIFEVVYWTIALCFM